MKYLILMVTFIVTATTYAQVREYYKQKCVIRPTETISSAQDKKIEFSGVDLSYGRQYLKNFLINELNCQRSGYSTKLLNDSVILYKERFLEINANEINPSDKYLDIEYLVHTLKTDSIIENIIFSGSEKMLGNLYKHYWNGEINLLQNADQPVVAALEFRSDSVLLQQTIVKQKNKQTRSYTIMVKAKKGNIKEVIEDTKLLLTRHNNAINEFNSFRRLTTFQLAEASKKEYQEYQSMFENILISVLHQHTNKTGTITLIVKADTIGRTWIEVLGKNASVNQELREELRELRYPNIRHLNFLMTTVDTFHFEYSCIHELVELRKNTVGVRVNSQNFPEIASIAKQEAMRAPIRKADLTYDVSHVRVNNINDDIAINTKREDLLTGGQVIGGTLLTILSLILGITAE